MTKYAKILILTAALLATLIVVLNTVFKVRETEQVVITQFGKPVGEPKTTPGLKLKVPFIQKVNYFEKRFMEWDGDPNQVPTKDKKFIFVEAYARWQITDPLQFFKRLTDERGPCRGCRTYSTGRPATILQIIIWRKLYARLTGFLHHRVPSERKWATLYPT